MLRKRWKKTVFMTIATMFLLAGCNSGIASEIGTSDTLPVDFSEIYTLSDADKNTVAENPKQIEFEAGEDIYLIEEPGSYLLSGVYTGRLQINVQDEMVHLILQDADLKSTDGPAIYVESAAKVIITVPEGSNSILTDSTNATDSSIAKACIYSEDDLTINGSGSLQIYGYNKDAIRTKDTLKLLDLQLTVLAKGDGLRGNDGVVVQTSSLEIECEGTGIYTEKTDKENRGYVDIASGTVNIIAGKYGVSASENMYIHDCKANIYGIIQNLKSGKEQFIEEGCLE